MKKRRVPRIIAITILILFVGLSFYAARQTYAFNNGYEFTDENDLLISVSFKKASSTATIKYSLQGWYLFKEPLGEGVPGSDRDYTNAEVTEGMV